MIDEMININPNSITAKSEGTTEFFDYNQAVDYIKDNLFNRMKDEDIQSISMMDEDERKRLAKDICNTRFEDVLQGCSQEEFLEFCGLVYTVMSIYCGAAKLQMLSENEEYGIDTAEELSPEYVLNEIERNFDGNFELDTCEHGFIKVQGYLGDEDYLASIYIDFNLFEWNWDLAVRKVCVEIDNQEYNGLSEEQLLSLGEWMLSEFEDTIYDYYRDNEDEDGERDEYYFNLTQNR